jgi:surfactin synthase thioesterase subunit
MKEQLFMLHFSGGSVYSFRTMIDKLKDYFTPVPVELPGRGMRFGEELISDRDAAVKDLLTQIQEKRNGQPFYIYGHSLGAEMGLLVTKELEMLNDQPAYLIVSGNAGPNVRDEILYNAPSSYFWKKLNEWGGVTAEILNSEELTELFEPILRADFGILEKDIGPITGKIKTPVLALMGSEERNAHKILNWEGYVEGEFSHLILSGNHFFIFDHIDTLCEMIIRCKKSH